MHNRLEHTRKWERLELVFVRSTRANEVEGLDALYQQDAVLGSPPGPLADGFRRPLA